jgi:hypothetical protein
MKNILWIIIGAMCLVSLIELSYIGETSLAFVILAIAISVGVLAYNQLPKK